MSRQNESLVKKDPLKSKQQFQEKKLMKVKQRKLRCSLQGPLFQRLCQYQSCQAG